MKSLVFSLALALAGGGAAMAAEAPQVVRIDSGEVKGAVPGKAYRVFSDEELLTDRRRSVAEGCGARL